ncbi:MAG: 16S rRNA (adenine(1518)-N(6)/adenine(1519)-N(6))-dimethyltransferase RsmA [Candidatus Omnitrophota bacterium]
MLTISQLKDVFSGYGFTPLKRLGENYLVDTNIKDKIIAEARIGRGDTVLEIGPGLGALTIDLAKTGARVCAVDKDKKAVAILRDLAGGDHPNLKILNGDILSFDIGEIAAGKKIKVVGNLPYYITTPVLEHLIKHRASIESILVTVQKEVAGRLMASPGEDDYGAISCFVQYYMSPTYLHTIKRNSFYPVPGVDSALMRLDVREQPPVSVADEAIFFRIVRGAFNQRRKVILNSLSRKGVLNISKKRLQEVLAENGISADSRPERLALSDFAAISDAFSGW